MYDYLLTYCPLYLLAHRAARKCSSMISYCGLWSHNTTCNAGFIFIVRWIIMEEFGLKKPIHLFLLFITFFVDIKYMVALYNTELLCFFMILGHKTYCNIVSKCSVWMSEMFDNISFLCVFWQHSHVWLV